MEQFISFYVEKQHITKSYHFNGKEPIDNRQNRLRNRTVHGEGDRFVCSYNAPVTPGHVPTTLMKTPLRF